MLFKVEIYSYGFPKWGFLKSAHQLWDCLRTNNGEIRSVSSTGRSSILLKRKEFGRENMAKASQYPGWWLNPFEKYESKLGLFFPIHGKSTMFQTTNQITISHGKSFENTASFRKLISGNLPSLWKHHHFYW